MNSPQTCAKCGKVVAPENKFCGSCGTAVRSPGEPGRIQASPEPRGRSSDKVVCPLCGQPDDGFAPVCSSCGAVLPGTRTAPGTEAAPDKVPARRDSSAPAPLEILQNWKVIAGFLFVIVAGLSFVIFSRTPEKGAASAQPPGNADMSGEISRLENFVASSPEDARSLLRLANLLHDSRSFTKAVAAYQRYLSLQPGDADARVDMGTCFFDLAVGDSVRREEYLSAARTAMIAALQSSPRHQLAHFNLGIISLHEGDMNGATEWFKKCTAIDPNSPAGRQAQQLVSQHSFTN